MKRRGFIAFLLGLFFFPFQRIAQAICNPSLIRRLDSGPHLVQARPGTQPRLDHYYVQWFGHSSFLIHSGSGTKVVTDPNFNVTPGIEAHAVTVSNDHYTHNNVGVVAGDPRILRGITVGQTWNPIRTTVQDMTIVNLPSQRGLWYDTVANSIFIYEMGSLCLAHMGNIGHLLTPEQQNILNRVDVIMAPIDARTNLGFEDLLKVIEQLDPPVVIPMHYDVLEQAELFASFIGPYYPVRHIGTSQLLLSRSVLPRSTEIFILTHPQPVLWEE